MEAVFHRYEKAQQAHEQMKAYTNAEKERLANLKQQIESLVSQVMSADTNRSDLALLERQIAVLKQQYEPSREAAEREISRHETSTKAAILEEIQDTIATLAKAKGLNYVVTVSPEPKPNLGPSEVMAALHRSVVYSDPRNDLTEEVIRELNHRFKAAGAKTSK
jgi:Skp family chaperone for outer membrane proteins